jgi:hypothetical protein
VSIPTLPIHTLPTHTLPTGTDPATGAAARPRRARTRWPAMLLLAALLAFADGFWLTTTQGAVGAIERAQSPFTTWLRDSALSLPLYVLAVLAALAVARRRLGPGLRGARRVFATALLVAVAGTVVGTAELVASAAYDYKLQVSQLDAMHAAHLTANTPPPVATVGSCPGLCAEQRLTLQAHERAARYAATGELVTNVVLVGWGVALLGGSLDGAARRRA